MKEFNPQCLKKNIANALIRDRFYLNKQLKKLIDVKKQQPFDEKVFNRQFTTFNQILTQSVSLLAERQAIDLTIRYPEGLPVSQKKSDISEAIRAHQVVIVAGETGSGKTTQLGKICLELGRGRSGQIAHTQPRRVAATSVAKRIAEELDTALGSVVGYQIRFKDHSTDTTLLKLMTDGVLLAEIGRDRWLNHYDTLIIDEAHERSLNIDFLLGYLKQLLPKRPDLKVIITSATIDVEKFPQHFNNAPIISVEGRSFEVENQYRPVEELSDEIDINQAIEQVLIEIEQHEKAQTSGLNARDVLVFLPGEHDIRQASLALRRSTLSQVDILPLYARLNQSEHDKIFRLTKTARRRVILATNVAETSLTVPGIGYVIDSGLARISRYSHRSKVQRLPIEKISKASANQRAGRCGRIANGVCYRLYSEEDFNLREDFTEPEIQRTNLSQVILQMLALKLGDIERFKFIQPPEQKLINDGLKQLMDLAAIDENRRLTPIGKAMYQWPLDPKLARMLEAAKDGGCMDEMLIIVSALASRDPREYPAEKKEAAREKHKTFIHPSSDFMSFLLLWSKLEDERQALSSSQFKKYCQRQFISWQRLKEWRDIHKQLSLLSRSLKTTKQQEPATENQIHKALLSGLALQIGFQAERFIFSGTRNRQFRLFPTSSLYKKPPKWVMVSELLETSQLYGHTAAKIEPEWILETSPHLLKYHYFEPHFSSKQGRVMAYQKTSLYGLVLDEKKRVGYANIDSKKSREILIRAGLVEGQMKSQAAFYRHNRALVKDIEELEEKTRRRDLLASDDEMFEFYHQLLPSHIANVRSLERWAKDKNNASVLMADRSVFLKHSLDNMQDDFPSLKTWEGVSYALSYRFQPGRDDDGVTVSVPVTTLNRVPKFLFEWLVPGLLQEKCDAMIRTLPKQYRRQLVPIPNTVIDIMTELKCDDKPLSEALCGAIQRVKSLKIPPDAFQIDKLDRYYLPLFELIDEKNNVLEKSRDLGFLINTYGHKVKQALDKKLDKQQLKSAKRWEFGRIQKKQQFKQSGTLVTSFPALEDGIDSVKLVLTDYPAIQEKTHRKGVVRLAMLTLPQQVKYLKKSLLATNQLQLKLTAEFEPDRMKQDLLYAAFNHCFFSSTLPYEQADFQSVLDKNRQDLASIATMLEKTVQQVMDHDYDIRMLLSNLSQAHHHSIKNDIMRQRQSLLYPGFIYNTPIIHFKELPRYFNALKIRLERLGNQFNKDVTYTDSLNALQTKIDDLLVKHPNARELATVITLNWMLQEYRVSLFAQQLKTLYPVSQKRIEKQWQIVLQDVNAVFS